MPTTKHRNHAVRDAHDALARELEDARAAVSEQTRTMLDVFRLADVFSHLLRRAHFAAEELFAREFAQESITPRQKAALVILYQRPGVSQNVLAEHLHMDRNTVAEMAKRLAGAGLIRRVPARADHRAYELFLTRDGAALLDRVIPRDAAVEQMVLGRMPAEYRPLFLKGLRMLVGESPDEPAQSEPADPPRVVSDR